MKKFLPLALCILLLFVATVPAYADVDMSWWLYTSTAKPTATPAPTAKPETSSSCSMCDDTGYTALKTSTGDYVAVPCPQCSNSGGTTKNTTSSTSQFEEAVQSFMDYLKQRFKDHNKSFPITIPQEPFPDEMLDIIYNSTGISNEVGYENQSQDLSLSFKCRNYSNTVDEITVSCHNPDNMETIVLTALIICEATGQLDQNAIDWLWDTSDNLLTNKGDSDFTYTIGSNTINFDRVYMGGRSEYPYVYRITIK